MRMCQKRIVTTLPSSGKGFLWIYLPCFLMRSFPLPILSHCNRQSNEDRAIWSHLILWSFNSRHRQKVKNWVYQNQSWIICFTCHTILFKLWFGKTFSELCCDFPSIVYNTASPPASRIMSIRFAQSLIVIGMCRFAIRSCQVKHRVDKFPQIFKFHLF